MIKAPVLPLALLGCFAPLWAMAEVEHIELLQRPEVMAQQQRLVGNLRAVARREGVVVHVPQLYVFHGDGSEAYHLEGFRPGFERELELTISRHRGARSMVRLDRLLERVTTTAGAAINLDDLPTADLVLALYRRADCSACDQVAATLDRWIAEHPERRVLWLDVRTDPARD